MLRGFKSMIREPPHGLRSEFVKCVPVDEQLASAGPCVDLRKRLLYASINLCCGRFEFLAPRVIGDRVLPALYDALKRANMMRDDVTEIERDCSHEPLPIIRPPRRSWRRGSDMGPYRDYGNRV